MEISSCGAHEAAIRFPFRWHRRTSAPVIAMCSIAGGDAVFG
jgi:hypothetical protein